MDFLREDRRLLSTWSSCTLGESEPYMGLSLLAFLYLPKTSFKRDVCVYIYAQKRQAHTETVMERHSKTQTQREAEGSRERHGTPHSQELLKNPSS